MLPGTTRPLPIEGITFGLLFLWAVVSWLALFWHPLLTPGDFGLFYRAAEALRDGLPVYDRRDVLVLLPPHALLLLEPLLAWPVLVAAYFWLGLNLVALTAVAFVVARELQWRPQPCETVAILALPAVLLGGLYGQCAWLLALPMALGWKNLRHGRHTPAALWFGVATAVKPLLLPLGLLLLWRRHAAAFAAWILAGLITVAVGVSWCGLPVYMEWMSAERLVRWYHLPANASVVGIAARLVGDPHPTFREFTPLAIAVAVLCVAGVAIVSFWRLKGREDVDRDLAVTLLGALLIFPLGWIYYLPMAAGPLVALWQRRRPFSPFWFLAALPLWWPAGLGWSADRTAAMTWRGLAVDSLYAIGFVALWGLTVALPAECASTGAVSESRTVAPEGTAICHNPHVSPMAK